MLQWMWWIYLFKLEGFFFSPWDKYPEVELLNYRLVLFSVFWGISILFSKVAAAAAAAAAAMSLQSCPTQRPHGWQPTRLLRPWDFPGKSTGVGCHCLLGKWLHWFPFPLNSVHKSSFFSISLSKIVILFLLLLFLKIASPTSVSLWYASLVMSDVEHLFM